MVAYARLHEGAAAECRSRPTSPRGYGYMVAQALVVVLEQCKNDLSRDNIMAQAANLKDVPLPMLMPGITLNTSPTDYRPIKDGYMVEFRDNQFNVISELLRGS